MIDQRPLSSPTVAAEFESHRRHLNSVAYRFLGSISEAEDMVQETYLRWTRATPAEVADTRAYLTRIITRLCLDHLKSARVRREKYVGTWLPEPLVQATGFATGDLTQRCDDISVALMLALERLSPLERAAFVLHDVFGQSFDEIARGLDRSVATCRQLAARARKHVRESRPRFKVADDEAERLVHAFMNALQSGDLVTLTHVLAPDAVLHSDGGPVVRAARRPILGSDRIARMFISIYRKWGRAQNMRPVSINSMPGLIVRDYSGLVKTLAFDFREGAITTIYLVRNPEKLKHLSHLI